jgi:REP element-mobilizing transposase RayT
MPQSYARIELHTTFGTKYRTPWIDERIEPELHAILAEQLRSHGCVVREINGTADHVHLLHTLPRTKCIADVMKDVKAVSSRWIKTKGLQYANFDWQDGYATFSADYRRLNGIRHYVRHQKEHHGLQGSNMTFVDEFTKLMNAYGYPDYTKQYVFPDEPANNILRDPARPRYRRTSHRTNKRWKRKRLTTPDPEGRLT